MGSMCAGQHPTQEMRRGDGRQERVQWRQHRCSPRKDRQPRGRHSEGDLPAALPGSFVAGRAFAPNPGPHPRRVRTGGKTRPVLESHPEPRGASTWSLGATQTVPTPYPHVLTACPGEKTATSIRCLLLAPYWGMVPGSNRDLLVRGSMFNPLSYSSRAQLHFNAQR